MANLKGKASFNPEFSDIKRTEMVLKVTKEVVVKFIEMGKVSPVSFDAVFQAVFATVDKAVSSSRVASSEKK